MGVDTPEDDSRLMAPGRSRRDERESLQPGSRLSRTPEGGAAALRGREGAEEDARVREESAAALAALMRGRRRWSIASESGEAVASRSATRRGKGCHDGGCAG